MPSYTAIFSFKNGSRIVRPIEPDFSDGTFDVGREPQPGLYRQPHDNAWSQILEETMQDKDYWQPLCEQLGKPILLMIRKDI